MPSILKKPLFGLLLLLSCPWVGMSGRANANFLIDQQEAKTGRGARSLPFVLDVDAEARVPCAGGGASDDLPGEDAPAPGRGPLPGKQVPVHRHLGLETNGGPTSSDSTSSGGHGSGLGSVFLNTTEIQFLLKQASGSLILPEEFLKPDCISSRLFRPPR